MGKSENRQSAKAVMDGQREAITLPAAMTIESVEALHQDFLGLDLHDGELLELNASAVERLGAAGLQLLIALERTVISKSGTLRVVGMNPICKEMIKDLGFEHWGAQYG